jgi:hypothetical protein
MKSNECFRSTRESDSTNQEVWPVFRANGLSTKRCPLGPDGAHIRAGTTFDRDPQPVLFAWISSGCVSQKREDGMSQNTTPDIVPRRRRKVAFVGKVRFQIGNLCSLVQQFLSR